MPALAGSTLLATNALASTCPSLEFCVTDTVTNTGSLSAPVNFVTSSGYPQNGPIFPTTSLSLSGNAFGTGTEVQPGTDFPTSETNPPGGAVASGWNFYDDYIFSIPNGASVSSAAISISSAMGSISNLEVRLFSMTGNPVPTIGVPVGGATNGWSTNLIGLSTAYLMPKTFGPGIYDLQFRGESSGVTSYGGNVNFTAVPLPAALPLLVSGLGLLRFSRRRRSAVRAA
jgi:hypothetical protein